MFIGLLVGLGFLLVSRLFEDSLQRALVSVVSAYTAFLAANEWLEVSGVIAIIGEDSLYESDQWLGAAVRRAHADAMTTPRVAPIHQPVSPFTASSPTAVNST